MSARNYVTIWCDGCEDWCEAVGPEHTAKDARATAKKVGWSVGLPHGRDLCPRCRDDDPGTTIGNRAQPDLTGARMVPIGQVPLSDHFHIGPDCPHCAAHDESSAS
jgi:hypothetical protein